MIPHNPLKLYLYGPPGSGKSTLGRAIAALFKLPFTDLDAEIEAASDLSIPEIFAAHGEGGFRQLERRLLKEICLRPTGVVSLGGGALLDNQSRQMVERDGLLICLQAPVETLAARLAKSQENRPLLRLPTHETPSDQAAVIQERLTPLLHARAEHYTSFPLQLNTAACSLDDCLWEIQRLSGRFRVTGMPPEYNVLCLQNGLDTLPSLLATCGLQGPYALVADSNVAHLYGDRLLAALHEAGYEAWLVSFPAGEASKTLATVAGFWDSFIQLGLERRSTVISLGGGVTNDLAGFAAAVYLRGIRWVTLPTSLLAMVDASIGGKTGADLPQGKNLVGAFHPPGFVLVDPALLDTLPTAELVSGMAEVVKAGVIADPNLFALCAEGYRHFEKNRLAIIKRAIGVKVKIISTDPFERDLRAALNFGHTLGHALEHASSYRLRHGEAVAIGMQAEARLAEELGFAEPGLADEIAATLHMLNLPTTIPKNLDPEMVINALNVDKKRAAGQIRFSLPLSIGQIQTGIRVEKEALWSLF